jgi:hypothetical protein
MSMPLQVLEASLLAQAWMRTRAARWVAVACGALAVLGLVIWMIPARTPMELQQRSERLTAAQIRELPPDLSGDLRWNRHMEVMIGGMQQAPQWRQLPEPAKVVWMAQTGHTALASQGCATYHSRPSAIRPTISELADLYRALDLPVLAEYCAAFDPAAKPKDLAAFDAAMRGSLGECTTRWRAYITDHAEVLAEVR